MSVFDLKRKASTLNGKKYTLNNISFAAAVSEKKRQFATMKKKKDKIAKMALQLH
jgi:hypothetical protein